MFTIGFIVFIVHLTRPFLSVIGDLVLSLLFTIGSFGFLGRSWTAFSSSVSTVPNFEDVFSHNVWNPLLELLFHEQVSGIFEPFVDEIDLAKIALSCHFALDVPCYKEGGQDSARRSIEHPCPWSFFFVCGTIANPATS